MLGLGGFGEKLEGYLEVVRRVSIEFIDQSHERLLVLDNKTKRDVFSSALMAMSLRQQWNG